MHRDLEEVGVAEEETDKNMIQGKINSDKGSDGKENRKTKDGYIGRKKCRDETRGKGKNILR